MSSRDNHPQTIVSSLLAAQMSDDDWILVQKAPRRPKPRYVSENQAFTLQRDLDIAGLAPTLLSIESRNLQADGWKYDRVLKGVTTTSPDGVETTTPAAILENTTTTEYTWLAVENKWGDRVLFSRPYRHM